MSNEKNYFRKKLIPIIPIFIRCEKKWCTVISIPLRVYKASTIHKAQGIIIGPGNPIKV